jgi:hypothetical protein
MNRTERLAITPLSRNGPHQNSCIDDEGDKSDPQRIRYYVLIGTKHNPELVSAIPVMRD